MLAVSRSVGDDVGSRHVLAAVRLSYSLTRCAVSVLNVDIRRRLRSADSAMLVVPSTRRSTLSDRAFSVARRHVRGTACRRL